MVSSYTTNKRIEKPANGDYNNTWSTPVNSDWDIIDRAFGGTTTLNAVSASGTVALTVNQYQAPIIAIQGLQSANINYQLPAGVGGFWFVFNNASGSGFSTIFSSAGGGSTVTLAQGRTTAVICDGTNVGLADTSIPSAGGSTTQVQYNLSGQLAGSSGFVFDGTNVGIGTTTLNANLHVANATTTDAIAIFDGSDTTNVLHSLSVRNIAASGTGVPSISISQWRTSFAGNTDVGQLRFDGLTLAPATYNEFASIYASAGANTTSGAPTALVFNTQNAPSASTERMRITAAGNVGIGTTNPSAKLQVSGGTVGTTAGNLLNITIDQGLAGTNAVGVRTNLVRVSNGTDFTTTAMRLQGRVDVTDFGYIDLVSGGAQGLAFGSGSTEFLRILSTGGITSSGLADAVGYKGLPRSTNTTAAVGDIGKHIYVATSVTINPSIFSEGDGFVIVNSNAATTSISINPGTNVILRLAGTTTVGARTIAPNGMASVLCVVGGANPTFLVSGAGVS